MKLKLLIPLALVTISTHAAGLSSEQTAAISKTLLATPVPELPPVVVKLVKDTPTADRRQVEGFILRFIRKEQPAALQLVQASLLAEDLLVVPAENRPPITPGNENGNRPIIPPGQIKYGTP